MNVKVSAILLCRGIGDLETIGLVYLFSMCSRVYQAFPKKMFIRLKTIQMTLHWLLLLPYLRCIVAFLNVCNNAGKNSSLPLPPRVTWQSTIHRRQKSQIMIYALASMELTGVLHTLIANVIYKIGYHFQSMFYNPHRLHVFATIRKSTLLYFLHVWICTTLHLSHVRDSKAIFNCTSSPFDSCAPDLLE